MTYEEARERFKKRGSFCDYYTDACDGECEKCSDMESRILEALEKQSEIVHCKDCKYWVKATIKGFNRTPQVPACELAGWLCGEEGFCFYGVRKAKDEVD